MINKVFSNNYLNNSKTFYYSLLFIAPLFFLYEIMCWLQYADEVILIRNSVDVFILNLIKPLENNFTQIILLFLFFILILVNKDNFYKKNINLSILFVMIVESILWSIALFIILAIFNQLFLSILNDNIIFEKYYLAIGAGIWEEFLFRVILITLFIKFLNKILNYNYYFSAILSILLSSILFSFFHYIGPLGDQFLYSTFFLRSTAGIFLGILYLLRGYGISVYTHVIYDFFIISAPVIINKY